MSTYKLSEQIANKMITDLKTGNSIFQRPDNNMHSAMPFNLESGNRYPGPSALVLLMQKRDDPRWATFEQANRNHTAVNKGATGTYINFMTQYEYQKVMKDGEPILKKNGKPRMERIRLDEPKEVTAKLFNAEQLRKMPEWEKEPALLSPVERAEQILDNSKVTIEHGGDDMLYDKGTDSIVIPEKEHFASPEQYAAEALHQLVHRELGSFAEDNGVIKEELRANLASLFLSKELNLPYDLNYHVGYTSSWGQLLKEEPDELFKAADDAQKIMDRVMGFEQKIEMQQETAAEQYIDNGETDQQQTQQETEQQPAKSNPNKLETGDVIRYKGNEFTVISEQKNKVLKVQDASGDKFNLKPKDGLYSALLHARNNPLEASQEMEQGIGEEESMNQEQEEETDYSISR